MAENPPSDDLSGWTLPPPAARARGEVEPVRVFDSAEKAMAFLARHVGAAQRRGRHRAADQFDDSQPARPIGVARDHFAAGRLR